MSQEDIQAAGTTQLIARAAKQAAKMMGSETALRQPARFFSVPAQPFRSHRWAFCVLWSPLERHNAAAFARFCGRTLRRRTKLLPGTRGWWRVEMELPGIPPESWRNR